MTKLITITTASILLLLFCGCRDNSPTPTGSSFFSCKIDGQLFSPPYKNDWGHRSVEARLDGYNLYIDGATSERSVGITIKESGSIKLNTPYILGPNPSDNVGMYDADLDIGWYVTDSINNGQLIITSYGGRGQAITGHFYFSAYDSTKNDTVHITDGVFSMYVY